MKGAVNIANGQGTAIDEAIMATCPSKTCATKSVRQSRHCKQRNWLERAAQDLFDRVVDGKLTVNQGAIVGRAALDAQVGANAASRRRNGPTASCEKRLP